MSKKDSTSKLAIVFVLLLLIVAVIYFTGTGKKERNFKKDIVTIDTSAVTEIFIYPKSLKGKYLKIFRSDNGWMINYDSNKTDDVPSAKVKNLFNELLKIKTVRVAARSKKKWDFYKVTPKATRIKVVEDGDTTLNLIIGKFSYKPQKQKNFYYGGNQSINMSTYVRLAGEDEVYEVNEFLPFSFDRNANTWRNDKIIKGNSDTWNRIVFEYPADSSFQLVKVDKKWKLNGKDADSLQTVRTLRSLSNVFSQSFFDNVKADSLKQPEYKVTIEGEKDTIVVKGFRYGKNFIISTSQNPGTFFNGKQNNLRKRIFVPMSKFLKQGKKK